eukprot:Clim_evm33s134 gene=Clim_evmTU33s134
MSTNPYAQQPAPGGYPAQPQAGYPQGYNQVPPGYPGAAPAYPATAPAPGGYPGAPPPTYPTAGQPVPPAGGYAGPTAGMPVPQPGMPQGGPPTAMTLTLLWTDMQNLGLYSEVFPDALLKDKIAPQEYQRVMQAINAILRKWNSEFSEYANKQNKVWCCALLTCCLLCPCACIWTTCAAPGVQKRSQEHQQRLQQFVADTNSAWMSQAGVSISVQMKPANEVHPEGAPQGNPELMKAQMYRKLIQQEPVLYFNVNSTGAATGAGAKPPAGGYGANGPPQPQPVVNTNTNPPPSAATGA